MLQRKKLPRGQAAFTLIEVALAASVLLFAIVSAFQLVASGTRMLDFSRKQTMATQIIHAEIDQAHLAGWTTVKNWADTNASCTITLASVDSTYTSGNSLFGYPELTTFQTAAGIDMATTGYTIQRNVSYVGTRTDMVQVTFVVTWQAINYSQQNGTSHTYSRQGTTYVGKNGLSATYQHP